MRQISGAVCLSEPQGLRCGSVSRKFRWTQVFRLLPNQSQPARQTRRFPRQAEVRQAVLLVAVQFEMLRAHSAHERAGLRTHCWGLEPFVSKLLLLLLRAN